MKGCGGGWNGLGRPRGDERLPVPVRLVIDANTLFSAYLKDSMARRILTHSPIEFSAPAFLFEEVERHLPSLRDRAGLSQRRSSELFRRLRERIAVVPEESTRPFWGEAKAAMEAIDPRDVAYVAAALAFPCDGIWSDDAHLKRQTLVACWSTKELVAELRDHGFPL